MAFVSQSAPPQRKDGYARIRDYAAIGDGRTVALVARDGSVDWLCLPDLDCPSVFGALLDAERGGRFQLEPQEPFGVERRYLPGTNVLETVFSTSHGAVRITDAMTLPDGRLSPLRELARRVEGLSGRVALRWRVEPRFGYGGWPTRMAWRAGSPMAAARGDAVGVRAWNAGEVTCDARGAGGRFETREGNRALLVLAAAHGEPIVFPGRSDVEARIDRTEAFWRRWSEDRPYKGPWRDAVVRSALALKLLVYAPSGAIAAAATTSLPEHVGGTRNWDYRFCWIRDSAFTLDSLLQLDCLEETHSFFWWFMHATQLTHPRLQVFYRLDGGTEAPERDVGLHGYEGSRPVRVGNGAADQLQLDTYGDLFDTAWLYVSKGHHIDRDTGAELAEVADLVCELWRKPDRGIWEVRMEPRHFTHSKAMCWVALDRACRLAGEGCVPGKHVDRWRHQAGEIRRFVERECWSEPQRSYVRWAGSEEVDASLLLMSVMRYHDPRDPRIQSTIDAVRRRLAHGPFVFRYIGEDGIGGSEGAFLCCSFWLVQALALADRVDEAAELMESLLAFANDVGLYAEELDTETKRFLGNFPQALVHLSLIAAASAFGEHEGRSR